MECLNGYMLTTLFIEAKGNVVSRNMGVTFDVFEAEAHQAHGLENDFDTFVVSRGVASTSPPAGTGRRSTTK